MHSEYGTGTVPGKTSGCVPLVKHMKKRYFSFLSLLLSAVLLLTAFTPCLAASEPPEVNAKAAVLLDAESGETLYTLNADTPLYVGGLTVMMTALLAAEAVDRGEIAYDDVVTASSTSHNDLSADASIQNIIPGEEMPLKDLLYCALIGSGSDACNIIAEYVAGSWDAFIRRMNERAKELGCTGTNFVNAHGLPNDNNYSTALDMARIAAAFVDHTELMEIANTISYEVKETNESGVRRLSNSNYILRTDYTRYYYSYACGIKSGYTDEAGFCLASAVQAGGSYVVSVVLGCKVIESDAGFNDIQSFVQTRELFRWFNSNYSLQDVVSTLEPIAEVPVALGDGVDSVVVCSAEGLSIFLPNDFDLTTGFTRRIRIFSQEPDAEELTAPVSRGDVLGEITVTATNGTVYGPYPLVANTDVSVSRLELMRREIKSVASAKWFRIAFWTIVGIFVLYCAYITRYRILRRRDRRAMREARQQERNRR